MTLVIHRILLGILTVAAVARLWALGQNPPSLYWDEVALGYDAYSLFTTGKDHHGNPWPIIAFESYGDYKPPGYFYIAAPFVGLFGLNEWALRLPSALAGIISVFLVYLLALELFENKKVGVLAAFSLAIMPWHVHISRVAYEVNLATMWVLFGVLFLLKARKKNLYIIPSTVFFVLSAYTYHSLRLFGPLLAGFIVVLWCRKLIVSKWFLIAGTVAAVLMLPILINLRDPIVSKRFAETSFLNQSKAVDITNQLRTRAGNNFLARILYHRYWFWAGEIIISMSKHISPEFLFARGDGNSRHQTVAVGLLYWWMLLPVVLGLMAFRNRNYRLPLGLLFGWILLASIPPALSLPSPHALRFLPAVPAFSLLIGFGLDQLLTITQKHNHRMVVSGLALIMLFEASRYADDYLTRYPQRSSQDWQYGYRELISYLRQNQLPGELVQVTRKLGRPSMYFLFYNAVDPKHIQEIKPSLSMDQGEIMGFDSYRFIGQDPNLPGWIVSDIPLDSHDLKTKIERPDHSVAFYVYYTPHPNR